MKTKNYKNGSSWARAYWKPAGSGWEVGFVYGGKTLFCGNFVHSSEANKFYGMMKREITRFAKKYKVGKTYSQSWYKTFLTAQIQTCYYNFVNAQVRKHATAAARNWTKSVRTYNRMNRKWTSTTKTPAIKAA